MEEEYWEHINELLKEYNPQFYGKIETPEFRKEEYYEAMKSLKDAKVLALIGPRGVGKTTIMKQMMKELKKTLFFSFEREETRDGEVVEALMDVAISYSIKYLFLDEIQFVDGWDEILHKYYTSGECDVKVIISSSQPLSISKTGQQLEGILHSLYVNLLSFRDFLMMKGMELPDPIPEGMDEFTFLETQYKNMDRILVETLFREYLFKGAFPKLVNETDVEVIRNYIEDVVGKIIYHDLPYLFKVRKADKVYTLFQYLCEHMGERITISHIVKEVGINKRTVKRYLGYLTDTFLIKISQNYSKKQAKRTKKVKKIYPIHPSIAIQISGNLTEHLDSTAMEKYAECSFASGYLWRDEGVEIPIVLSDVDPSPIDIDYGNKLDVDRIKKILRFMEVFDSSLGAILTKDNMGRLYVAGKEIYIVPAWLIFSML